MSSRNHLDFTPDLSGQVQATNLTGNPRCQVVEMFHGVQIAQCPFSAEYIDVTRPDAQLCTLHATSMRILSHRTSQDDSLLRSLPNLNGDQNNDLSSASDDHNTSDVASEDGQGDAADGDVRPPSQGHHVGERSTQNSSGRSDRGNLSWGERHMRRGYAGFYQIQFGGDEASNDDPLSLPIQIVDDYDLHLPFLSETNAGAAGQQASGNDMIPENLDDISTKRSSRGCTICMDEEVTVRRMRNCPHELCEHCMLRMFHSEHLRNRFRCPQCRAWVLNTPEPPGQSRH